MFIYIKGRGIYSKIFRSYLKRISFSSLIIRLENFLIFICVCFIYCYHIVILNIIDINDNDDDDDNKNNNNNNNDDVFI